MSGKKYKARMAARHELPAKGGIGNRNDAFRKCVGRMVVRLMLSERERHLVFDDGSRLVLHSNGAFGWLDRPYTPEEWATSKSKVLREMGVEP